MQTNNGFALFGILVLIAAGVFLFLFTSQPFFSSEVEDTSNNITQEFNELDNVAIYSSPYWGFKISYPNNFTVFEVPEGVRIYNYDRLNKSSNYHPTGDELLIRIDSQISETPRTVRESSQSKKFTDVSVMGKEYAVRKRVDNVPFEGPYTTISSMILNDIFTYHFSAEPATPKGISKALSILSSMEFIPPEYFEHSKMAIPQGSVRYEDTRLGFAIDYPSNASFNRSHNFQGSIQFDEKYVGIIFLNRNNPSDNWIENVKWRIACSADGPGSSTDSPLDKMVLTEYTSDYGAEGYKVERTTVHKSNGTIINEVKDNVYVFPLNIQEYDAIAIGPAQDCLENNDPILDKMSELTANQFQYLSK